MSKALPLFPVALVLAFASLALAVQQISVWEDAAATQPLLTEPLQIVAASP